MPPKASGRIHKFLAAVGPELETGRTLDRVQIYLPDGTALDLTDLGGEPPEPAAPQFNPRGEWAPGEYDQGDVVMVENDSYWASETTSEEPGVTGAPLTPDDLFETIWVDGTTPINFDTSDGGTPGASDDPWIADEVSQFLYFPVTHVGHIQLALETFDDSYVQFALVKGSDMSLQGTGSSDNSIGLDFDNLGDWFLQTYHNPTFDAGHDPGPIVATPTLSSGLTLTPAPAGNPWVQFA